MFKVKDSTAVDTFSSEFSPFIIKDTRRKRVTETEDFCFRLERLPSNISSSLNMHRRTIFAAFDMIIPSSFIVF